ncbi:putative capsule polysaccharide biosynthesis protein [Rosellinia necatrix]|uniref:Putative capsule polysaccharide biosynthesis protein n=1 Tax=Rosellinia necatrix TaxID=77044 RepID=A0A1W2TJM5_ROSNE|nr:putative capsule polysaccharide biosynthesis protein [Rosellinia necatrix]
MAPSAVETSGVPGTASVGPANKADVPAGLRLIAAEKLDARSDEEIAQWLQEPHPITSDKNVWAYWHTGWATLPPWVRRNLIGWVRRLGPSWTVHLLDKVPGSATHVSHYVESSYFPAAFNDDTMDGPSVGPHAGDLVRLPLIWKYGGVWIDAGTLLFRHIDDICWNAIEDPATPYEMAGFVIEMRPGVDCMLNGFVAAKRGNPFIQRWYTIYKALWDGEGVTNATGFHRHPLLRHLPLLCPPVDKLNCPDLNMMMEGFSDYLAAFMCFERLRKVIDPSDGFSGPEYYAERMLLFPALQETYYFQQQTSWSGTRQFDMLSARRAGPGVVRDAAWQAAEDFVNDALANTSTMKLSHGPPGALDSFLADIWDSEPHRDADVADGSFAARLRYGSVRFDQTRDMVPIKMAWPTEEVLTCGILEPKKMGDAAAEEAQ